MFNWVKISFGLFLFPVFLPAKPLPAFYPLQVPVRCEGGLNSMAPTLACGQLLNVREADFTDALKDRIVLFHWDARAIDVVHRAIDARRDWLGRLYLVTKGDANPLPDPVRVFERQFIAVITP